MKQISAFVLLTLALLAAPYARAQLLSGPANQSGGSQRLDRIVAVVEDGIVLQSELDQAVAQVKQQYASDPQKLPPDNVLRRQVLERLVLMRLQVQRAEQNGVHVSDQEVSQAAQNVARQNHMSIDQLRQAIQSQGMSFGAFQRQLADQIMVQRLRQGVVHDQVQVTDAEINNLLNSPAFKAGEVHLAHIQISIPSGASAQQIQQAAAKAKQAEQAIHGGMDFNAAAIRYSDAQDALDGGDLGWRRLDALPPAFTDVVKKMHGGEVTPPMRGPNAFHILKLIARRQPERKMITEYHARQIMIQPSALLTDAQAKAKAEKIYHQIVDKHADFAKLAKKDSDDDTTANIGGDMGWFPVDAWGTAVAVKLKSLNDNQVSQPFHTQGGWHILQRLGTRKADRTDEVQRQQARAAITNRKAEQAYEDFLRNLRSTSYVHILVPSLREPSDSDKASS
ncbi:peptidylprolyl isomerase [Oleiagrimonas sp. C23AA]|uniref:peptidylprolyl isomerase n=1 Tax=Oleiagrimonas sp. C23AA TaxID=2719047 RepID=UPI001420388D|nr:peptidylprolyl isomerase [Oleiagrimonas sp. C23AA]NII09918.1 peptidylprolyl isomerase [Oleiagrimonas sp. C23AA]